MRFARACALVLLALGGCTTQAEKEVARMNAVHVEGLHKVEACVARLEAMPSYLALKDKLPPNGSNATIAMEVLTNGKRPNLEESAMLLELHRDGYSPCRKLSLDEQTRTNAAFGPPLASLYAKVDARHARLVKREISWGEYAAGVNEDRAAYRVEFQQTAARVNADLRQAHDAEVQRNANAMRAAAASIDANRPRTTYCTGVAPYITCTTY
jgi:hypothetical protein